MTFCYSPLPHKAQEYSRNRLVLGIFLISKMALGRDRVVALEQPQAQQMTLKALPLGKENRQEVGSGGSLVERQD